MLLVLLSLEVLLLLLLLLEGLLWLGPVPHLLALWPLLHHAACWLQLLLLPAHRVSCCSHALSVL